MVESITTLPHSDDRVKQWYDLFGVVDRNCFWLAETIYQNETKTTLATTAKTTTSNLSSICAYRIIHELGLNPYALNLQILSWYERQSKALEKFF